MSGSRAIARLKKKVSSAVSVVDASYQGIRHRALFDQVERYCMFIGYPRSGHSLVGSLLDTHPDIVIAHGWMH